MTGYTSRKQTETKNKNKDLIISALSEPKRFNELDKALPMSHTTLNKLLVELEFEKRIEKSIHVGKPVYQLTKSGKEFLADLNNLSRDVENIRSRGGKHYRFNSSLGDIFQKPKSSLGIESDLTLDKKLDKLDLLSAEDVYKIKKLVLKKITQNIKKQKLTERQTGQIVLGFVIDFPMIQDALHLTPKKLAKVIAKVIQAKHDDIPEKVKQLKPSKELLKQLKMMKK